MEFYEIEVCEEQLLRIPVKQITGATSLAFAPRHEPRPGRLEPPPGGVGSLEFGTGGVRSKVLFDKHLGE